jgi:hypothetical protein
VKRLAATERGGEMSPPTNNNRGQQPQWRTAMENIGIDVHKNASTGSCAPFATVLKQAIAQRIIEGRDAE